jgi:2-polyprenyl-6-methoxyphenol hydroxylase-like FAD-dependent oxidoreductase
VSTDTALQYIDGWEPFLTEILKATPGHRCTDWKLLWRNPQPKWTSPNARVIQLGDAAHSFLPTSGSGAAMAMEDAYSLATCLQLGGKPNAPFAVRVHNHLRQVFISDKLQVSKCAYAVQV